MFSRYEYIKNNYSSTAINLSRQRQLDPDPKVIQQMEFVEQLKKSRECIFLLTILEKIKKVRLKFSERIITVLLIIANY